MIFLELPVVAAIFYWSRWLSRRYGAPRWIQYIGWGAVVLFALSSFFTLFYLRRSFDISNHVDPAEKARVLAEGISIAMNGALAGIILLIVEILLLVALTWRYHWSAPKEPELPRSPPYR